ncbi:MAG: ANTAR domain-containing protein [Mycobacterium sp.]|uniref:ANTAR domain-containing protein n=1 Tax=Mycobacterium sp. TaxID=1785 RepID=UPI003C54A9F1
MDQIEGWTPQGEADAITKAVAEIIEHRAVIEQAKGVLMAVYSIDAQAAFDLLRWGSQHTNTKLRVMAEQLTTGFRSLQ